MRVEAHVPFVNDVNSHMMNIIAEYVVQALDLGHIITS